MHTNSLMPAPIIMVACFKRWLTLSLIVLVLGCSSDDSDDKQLSYRLDTVQVDSGNDGQVNEIYTLVYDDAGLSVGEYVDENADGVTDHSFEYFYGELGLFRSNYDHLDDGFVNGTRTFQYDVTGRLIAERVDDDNDSLIDRKTSYLFDGIESGISMLQSGAVYDSNNDGIAEESSLYSYDSFSRIITIETTSNVAGVKDSIVSFVYDSLGRVLTRSIDVGLDGVVETVWAYQYSLGLCQTFSNHQPMLHACVKR